MSTPCIQARPLRTAPRLLAFCWIGAIASLTVWLVNLEVAARHFTGLSIGIQWLLPGPIYHALSSLAIDYSTISTGLFVPLFVMPLVAARSIRNGHEPAFHPYPEWKRDGSIWTGLAGTLIGLMITFSGTPRSRDVSVFNRAEHLFESFLIGFPTAILSTLIGLFVWWLSVPMQRWFRSVFPTPVAPETEEFERVLRTLMNLLTAAASPLTLIVSQLREIQEYVVIDSLRRALKMLRAIVRSNRHLAGKLETLVTTWITSAKTLDGVVQAQQDLWQQLAQQYEEFSRMLQTQDERFASLLNIFQQFAAQQQQAEGRRELLLEQVVELAESRSQETSAIRRAFSVFVDQLPPQRKEPTNHATRSNGNRPVNVPWK